MEYYSSSSEPASPLSSPSEKTKGYESDDLEAVWRRRRAGGRGVMLEGYVDGGDDAVGRTKSLTDDDLEELKGCLDLGFGFNYDEIPELCSTLPALELCYSLSQTFLDEQHSRSTPPPQQQQQPQDGAENEPCAAAAAAVAATSAPVANWKFSSPGDDPEEVKARLKYWAQAVACTVRLCS